MSGNAASPINKEQASRGKIDYANVKSWGSGKPEELESLQLESFKAGGAKVPGQEQQNFYVQLTYEVAQATEQGKVNEVLHQKLAVKGRKNLPEYSTWSLSQARYGQYLVDQQHVHHALECSIAEALAVREESASVAAALDCFSEARGLDRSLEIATDLTNMGVRGKGGAEAGPDPTPAARSYARYIGRLGEAGVESERIEKRNDSCLRLIAHAYANHMLLLTRGSMVGKAAADRLGLFKQNAVNTYRSYPADKMGKDPFQAFKANVTSAGEALGEAERSVVKDELALAMAHAVQLWESLAYTD